MPPRTSLHLEQPGDEELLHSLFAEARTLELGALPDEFRATFLDQQFGLWQHHLEQSFPSAERLIIRDSAGTAIGRLVLEVTAAGIHVVDIAVLSASQRRGHGSAVMLAVLDRADATGAPITLTVASGNGPARAFYAGFGFVDITPAEGETGAHRALWRATPRARATQAATHAQHIPQLPEHAEFLRLVGSTFAAVDESGHAISLTLGACSELRRPATGAASYVLTFHGRGTARGQGIFTLAGPGMSEMALFLVPTQLYESETAYTATINLLEVDHV